MTAGSERERQLFDRLVAMRRELHEYPELSMEEYETTGRIRSWLEEAGVPVVSFPGLATGVVAEITGGLPGPTIALRADIDALPIQERTGLPFASKTDGKMHACGHDFHTASMIGAVILLNERKQELRGTVRVLFQPGEELAVGAQAMIQAGCLDGVSAIFGMHNKPDLPVGTVGVRPGPLMASVDRFEIDVIGVGGHAGVPNKAVDPIVAASHIVTGLQSIVSRNVSSLHNAVISVCSIHGGSAWNVIPHKVTLEGTVRTFQIEAREAIPGHMKRVAEGTAAAYGAEAELRWYPYFPAVDNDDRYTELVGAVAQELGYETVRAEQTLGGEDFAVYQMQIPGYFVWMGTSGTEEWHHPAFTLDERALLVSARYFARLAQSALERWT
ncbi:N-acetylcysteine deacetylase [Paenibacillus solanacearum]|uniref:N-acetylcysteine deacetylase n=1 Tax=Paenibacillus solanacearum TaxID=2048548 RepID=A0A916K3E8_9BACL|nr:amidohydrolase [Paenibacillus solanacearum]CAG7638458.1 N-acetylcysteine deacetylase [Paenibacillus solanacearum]